ncbi:hypothetical protein [Streptomyces hydrogenans]|uniref:hypothetical protein n=1 Tax=Streptomyces hydrogenans TaxID=1873719 RepID=UPI00167C6C57|nr:hypothetical protein [Streptomyces hydrogenans]
MTQSVTLRTVRWGKGAVTGMAPLIGLQVPADGVDVAVVAQSLDLPGKGGGVGAALRPAMVRVEAVVVDQGGPIGGCDEKFIDAGGACEAVDRAAAELEVARDGAKAVAAFDALVNLLVAVAGAGDQRPGPAVDVQLRAVVSFGGEAVVGPALGCSRRSAPPRQRPERAVVRWGRWVAQCSFRWCTRGGRA